MTLLAVSNSDIEIEDDARKLMVLFGSSVRFDESLTLANLLANSRQKGERDQPWN
jgi:hypothetical protein